jgi:hypothetical protein
MEYNKIMVTTRESKKLYTKLSNKAARLEEQLRLVRQEMEDMTEPCTGEAHSNGLIDNCSTCMGVTWGRQIKRVPVEE